MANGSTTSGFSGGSFASSFTPPAPCCPAAGFWPARWRDTWGGDGAGQRILEVGPGTGAVTAQIVRRLGPERSARPGGAERRVRPPAQRAVRHRDAVSSGRAAVAGVALPGCEELPVEEPYDLIISGLPLNNFSGGRRRGAARPR